jgi:putative NADH-flavin reductase
MSKIAIIGASGYVGTALTREALRRGHKVTAIVRNPEKITQKDPHLSAVKGDVLFEDQVEVLVKGHDAVLNAYNGGWQNPRLYDDFIRASKAIQEGTRKAGVVRLLVVGGAGSLEIAPGLQLVDTPEFPEAWKTGAQAARDYLDILRQEKALEWTFLSPAILLQPGERTGKYRVGKDSPVFDEKHESRISVEDLAVALLDAFEKHLYIKERFTVAY